MTAPQLKPTPAPDPLARPRRTPWLTAAVLLLTMFVAINILATVALRGVRLDLTEDKLFTLSDATRQVLARIDDPITLRLYISRDALRGRPDFQTFAARVEELLAEYRLRSAGRLTLQTIDVEPLSEAEDLATEAGLTALPLDTSAFLGLVATNQVDGREVIPSFFGFFRQQQFLEYEITRVIDRLTNPARPVIGLISALPIDGTPDMAQFGGQPGAPRWFIVEQLRQLYDLRVLAPDVDQIPPDVTMLLLVHPKGLRDAALRAIDAFALAGKPIVACLDGLSELDPAANPMANPMMGSPDAGSATSDLPRLLDAWGVAFTPGQIVVDPALGLRITDRQGQPQVYEQYLSFTAADVTADDPLMQGLETLQLVSVGAFTPAQGATTEFVPLLQTSDRAALIDSAGLRLMPPELVGDNAQPLGQPLTIAARVTGPIQTAFPDAPPPDAPPPDADAPPDDTTNRPTAGDLRLVLIGDSDFLYDTLWMQSNALFGPVQFADNPTLLLAAIDNLAGSPDMARLRARGSLDRPFTLIDRLEATTDARLKERRAEIEARVQEAQARINQLEAAKGDQATGRVVLTPEQEAEVTALERDLVAGRRELREIGAQLNADVQRVQTLATLLNTLAVPVLLAAIAFTLAATRAARRRADRRSMAGRG